MLLGFDIQARKTAGGYNALLANPDAASRVLATRRRIEEVTLLLALQQE